MVGEPGADRNVYPTKAGVPVPCRYRVSAGVWFAIAFGPLRVLQQPLGHMHENMGGS